MRRATPVHVSSYDIDFDLEIGGTIGGRVTDAETGLGISNISVEVFSEQCGERVIWTGITNSIGNYGIPGLPLGESFYVRTDQSSPNYSHEWYDGIGADICTGATPVVIPPASQINFELDYDTDGEGISMPHIPLLLLND